MPPHKLKCTSIVCGLGPPDIGMSGADFIHRIGFGFPSFRYAWVGAVRWFFTREPGGRLDLTDEKRYEMQMQLKKNVTNEKDFDFFEPDNIRVYLRSMRETFGRGFEAARDDGRLICSDFGFRVEDIRTDLPVHLWYGKQDTFVPLNHGLQITARLGGRAQLRVEDETHGSIWFRWQKEIFRDILRDHQRSTGT
jgi:pimeloyl-ACP methyl ester carboxylesterase